MSTFDPPLRTLAERELDDRLLHALSQVNGWGTSAGLADRLGVTRDEIVSSINRLTRDDLVELDPDWVVWTIKEPRDA